MAFLVCIAPVLGSATGFSEERHHTAESLNLTRVLAGRCVRQQGKWLVQVSVPGVCSATLTWGWPRLTTFTRMRRLRRSFVQVRAKVRTTAFMPLYTPTNGEWLQSFASGLVDCVVLFSRAATDSNRSDHPAVLLEGDAAGEDHDLSIVGGVNAEELSP